MKIKATCLLIFFLSAHAAENADLAKAVFAGGCFWCMEPPFDGIVGVKATISGYTGGNEKNPTYEQVSSGRTGHYESIEIVYDQAIVKYEELLSVFWKNIDPTDPSGQFCDKGPQYRSAIFYQNEKERKLAEESKRAVEKKLRQPVVTQILPLKEFYRAEEYHQDFYRKNPYRYQTYRFGCGRDRRLKEIWGSSDH